MGHRQLFDVNLIKSPTKECIGENNKIMICDKISKRCSDMKKMNNGNLTYAEMAKLKQDKIIYFKDLHGQSNLMYNNVMLTKLS